MPQVRQKTTSDLVKYTINLIAHGTCDDWKQQYRVREFNDVMPMKSRDALFMDFEYKDRWKLYHCVQQRFIGESPVDYLEFGVAGGESLQTWLGLNKQKTSRFFGFDSFQGLPEDWMAGKPKGAFDQMGRIPQFDDTRATIVDGLFQKTVDAFSRDFHPQSRLVIHMDADLYSSTLYCLLHLDRHIEPGTIILFDEFTARECTDEFAALQDYCVSCYRDYKVLVSRSDYVKLAVEIIH